jgi:hypothetical protein
VVSHVQLLDLGQSRAAIQHALRAGRLHRLHRRVYVVGHRSLSVHGRWMAAVLACGSGALLSHRDAGALFGIRPLSGTRVDVTVVGRTRHSQKGIALHLPRRLHEDDRALRDAIPVTSVSRTLLDLAEVLRPRQLQRAPP